jgi:hypothetical protein
MGKGWCDREQAQPARCNANAPNASHLLLLSAGICGVDASQSCSTGGAVQAVSAITVGIVIRRISNHSTRADGGCATPSRAGEMPDDFYRQKLKEALGAGMEALNDPEIEKRVEAYFRENPSFSRDAVHVAAVACQFKKEQIMASGRQETPSGQKPISRPLTI